MTRVKHLPWEPWADKFDQIILKEQGRDKTSSRSKT